MRAGVHRSSWSNLERGHLEQMSVGTVRRCLAVLEIRMDLAPRWRAADLDRLLDEDHAALQTAWSQRLAGWGWVVHAEVSFSRYGERGRVDLLAWHPSTRILAVTEVKTQVPDTQDLLGGLDVKTRLGRHLAQQMGWPAPAAVIPILLVADTSTNRRRLRAVDALFAHLPIRGKAAISWLREPQPAAGGLLLVTVQSGANVRSVRRGGTARIRPALPLPSVGQPGAVAEPGPDPG